MKTHSSFPTLFKFSFSLFFIFFLSSSKIFLLHYSSSIFLSSFFFTRINCWHFKNKFLFTSFLQPFTSACFTFFLQLPSSNLTSSSSAILMRTKNRPITNHPDKHTSDQRTNSNQMTDTTGTTDIFPGEEPWPQIIWPHWTCP